MGWGLEVLVRARRPSATGETDGIYAIGATGAPCAVRVALTALVAELERDRDRWNDDPVLLMAAEAELARLMTISEAFEHECVEADLQLVPKG